MTATSPIRLGRAIPALPALDVSASVEFYRERLGFEAIHHDGRFAVLRRDDAIVHLWQADDESWKERAAGEKPVCSGAESFIAGTASCRIEVEGVYGLYAELLERNVLHPVSHEGVTTTDFGTHEFATLDPDGNLIAFFKWVEK